MSNDTPEAFDFVTWVKGLVEKLMGDPVLLAKLKALFDALVAFFPSVPMAIPDAELLKSICHGAAPEGMAPEALGDIIGLVKKLYAFVQAHPELLSLLTWLLTLDPAPTPAPTPPV